MAKKPAKKKVAKKAAPKKPAKKAAPKPKKDEPKGPSIVKRLDEMIVELPIGQLKTALQNARRIAQIEGK